MQNKALFFGMVFLLVLLGMVYFQLQNPEVSPEELSQGIDAATYSAENDPEFQAAVEKARASLEYFLSMADQQPKDASGFSLRVALSEDDTTEYFWIYPFESANDDAFTGIIQDDPKNLTAFNKGQNIEFSRGQIIDWTFDDKAEKIMHGNYTGCVELRRQAPDHAEQFMELVGLDCSKR